MTFSDRSGEARDVLGDGPIEQLDVLRQVASEIGAEFLPATTRKRLAVKPHFPFDIGPDAEHDPAARVDLPEPEGR